MRRFFKLLIIFVSFFVCKGLNAQVSTFPYDEGFESTFTTGLNVEFIPDWTGNEVATTNRIFRDGTNQRTGIGSMAVIPISSFTAQITVDLNFSNLSNAVADFYARSVQNSTGTRPALVHFSTSVDGGNTYSTPVMIGSSVSFPNSTTLYTPYSYQFPSGSDGAANVKLRITVAQSPDSTGTTARFVMDDFSISGSSFTDTIAPSIISVDVFSSTQLDIKFSEPVTSASAQNLLNYSVNNSIGNPQTALLDGSDPSVVHLTFTNSFTPGVLYELTINNIEDLNSNILNNGISTFGIFTVQPGDIVINEIMADPDPVVGLPNFEYLELFNKTPAPVDLTGWTITIGSTVRTFPNVTIPADSFLIVGTAAAVAALQTYGPTATVFTSSTTLTNSGTSLTLKDDQGMAIDSLTYNINWYQDANKDDGGWSLERINPFALCSGATNWIASNDPSGGTPGRTNSVFDDTPDITPPVITSVAVTSSNLVTICFSEALDSTSALQLINYQISSMGSPVSATIDAGLLCVNLVLPSLIDTSITYTITLSGVTDCPGNPVASGTQSIFMIAHPGGPFDVIINEIMADPDPVVVLPAYEYVELFNRSGKAIDLTGWTITIGSSTRTFGSLILFPDSFLIVSTSTAAAELQQYGTVAAVLTSSTALTNSGTTITVRTASGIIVNSITYQDTWYDHPDKKDGGWSLERIDPSFLCPNNGNWTASNDPSGGTPGRTNSVLGIFTDVEPPRLIRAAVIDSINISITFSEPMDTISLLNTSIYSVNNGIGMPVNVGLANTGGDVVKLQLSQQILSGIIYTVSVASSVKDCSGNLISSARSARFGLPEPADPLDIVINEILFNPYTVGSDFVELYNRSNKIIDLYGLKIANEDGAGAISTIKEIINESYLLFPNG
ncbi:MAG: lamin tail domain-containing protein, partial [Bacteroidia bacterium]